jgi:hypothetical protein
LEDRIAGDPSIVDQDLDGTKLGGLDAQAGTCQSCRLASVGGWANQPLTLS